MSPRRCVFSLLLLLGTAALCLSAAQPAEAFCGFYVSGAQGSLYNDATQVVLMREGMRTALSMQNNYQGPPEDFAMVVPVPVILKEQDVKTLPHAIFHDVDQLASPRLVEYWEQDPCAYGDDDSIDYLNFGFPKETPDAMAPMADESTDLRVRIEAEFKVGEYDIVILSAEDSGGLDTWLRAHEYNIPQGAEQALRPYISQGMYFFVARVDLDKVEQVQGRALLSPLRFHYDSPTFALPIRLGLLNARQQQDLIVHVLARGQRYQVADRENVTIPTNLGVSNDTRERFGEFYAALLDRTLEKHPGAVVTEYAWSSGSCDPCPGPTLTPQHLISLGADVMPSGATWDYVLTRLHMRYGASDLKQDLVFQAAAPIAGGREHITQGGELEEGAQPSGANNFQARYIIRHPWEGEVECADPQYGVWGGPPGQHSPSVKPARDTAFAPRGQLELPDHITQAVPELGLTPTPGLDADAMAPQLEGGCASCAAMGGAQQRGRLGLLALAALGLLWLRRQRRD